MPKNEPWISVVTRRIAGAPVPGADMHEKVMTDLCIKYPQDKWDLVNTHYIGIDPTIVNVMFIFVRKA